jgi:hypothetical protein
MENGEEKLRAWVEGWKETGKVLEQLRRDKIKAANTITSIQTLDSAYRSAIRNRVSNPTSGLVEFHQLMNKLKTDD